VPKKIKIGVLKETKIPPDKRVALPPKRVLELLDQNQNVVLVVQPSELRCYKDSEYMKEGVVMQGDLSDCEILIGVKEVDISSLIPDKTYLFFSHVAKEQAYNRDLLRAILAKRIRLLDYEYFTDKEGVRLIAFGRWAGVVGAYNSLRGWGEKTGMYSLKPAHKCHNRKEMDAQLDLVKLKNSRILISGGGRVAWGVMETMKALGIREITPQEYLGMEFDEAVFCRIDPVHYVEHIEGKKFELQHFFKNPKEYKSYFAPFSSCTDIYIAAHYWNPDSPRMFELDEMTSPDFRIKMIADISCDINGSVPSTIRASTIAEPFYGFDPHSRTETGAFDSNTPITMMTVDNLPGELPRDASDEFSGILVKEILPRLIGDDPDGVVERATITENGRLTERYSYLEDYVKG